MENRSIQNIVEKKIELTTEFLPGKCLSDRKKSLSFSDIYKNVLEGEQTNSSRVPLSPPKISPDTSTLGNATSSSCRSNASEDIFFNTQGNEILGILEELQCSANVSVNNLFCENNVSSGTEQSRLSGYFASNIVFNLSRKVFSDVEIKVLEKGLDFAPIQNKINEPELRKDFEEFCRRMRIKWHFRNEPTQDFSSKPAFSPKSTWNPPVGHPNVEVFLSQIEHELFQISNKSLPYSNLSKEEWEAIRSLADDRSIVIKKADKGSCIVVWYRYDYLLEPEKQLDDNSVYKDVSFNEKLLSDLVENSKKLFQGLKRKGSITEKELKYFLYNL